MQKENKAKKTKLNRFILPHRKCFVYFTTNCKVDAEKVARSIKKYLKSSVTSGALIKSRAATTQNSQLPQTQPQLNLSKTPAMGEVKKKLLLANLKRLLTEKKVSTPKSTASVTTSSPVSVASKAIIPPARIKHNFFVD